MKQKIKLTNMKSVRFGKGVAELRRRANLSQQQLAEKVKIDTSYLARIEEGYVSEFESSILEGIAKAVNINMRGTPAYDDLINLFLYVPTEEPKMMI